MKREYPERPIVGVGAVIFVGDSVLLVQRNQEPGRGQWSLPGGAVELGETLVEALTRELWEEASIEIEIGGLVGVFDRIIRDRKSRPQFHYILVDYWGERISGRPHPGSDVSEVRLVPLGDLHMCKIGNELEGTILKAIRLRDSTCPSRISG